MICAQQPGLPMKQRAPQGKGPVVPINDPEPQSQIVSVISRLSGPGVLALLRRNGDQVEPASDDLLFRESAITNVTAGFYLGDSGVIAVKLFKPEAGVYPGAFSAVKPQIPARPSTTRRMGQS